MPLKYLSEFYFFKVVPPEKKEIEVYPETALEEQIRIHLLTGHLKFNIRKYDVALGIAPGEF